MSEPVADDGWRKSSFSGPSGCIEVRDRDDGTVQVRDSKDRGGPVLTFRRHEWDAFKEGVLAGEF